MNEITISYVYHRPERNVKSNYRYMLAEFYN